MLAVLKKRWKPKRAGSGLSNPNININNNNNNNGRRGKSSPEPEDKPRLSPRQVHPVSDRVSTAPNICVQGGRIEFIKPEILDPAKDKLEARVAELEGLLEEERKATLKERRTSARLQCLLDQRERGERDEAEEKLLALQAANTRLEEGVRGMAQYKHKYAQLKSDAAAQRAALESRVSDLEGSLDKMTRENSLLRAQVVSNEGRESVVERLGCAEAETRRLLKEREEVELCLDQVARQVVKALLAQKGLREEVCCLRDRVKELETQNRALSSLLLPVARPTATSALEVCVRPVSCDESKLRWTNSLLWVPLHRPRSLNLDTQQPVSLKVGGGESHKDEGYSTMSSEAQGENSSVACGGLERLQEESAREEEGGDSGRLVRSISDSELVVASPSSGGWASSSGGSSLVDWWEADPVQHWLRLEETRSTLHHALDLHPTIDLDEWTMDESTPCVSSVAESGAELEELWCLVSPGGDSWSSESSSKRSSTLSDRSATATTHFTSDFYRLVKFESTKSLASTSSRSDEPPQVPLDETAPSAPPPPSAPEEGLLTVPEEEEESSGSTPDTVLLEMGCSRELLDRLSMLASNDSGETSPPCPPEPAVPPDTSSVKSTGWVRLHSSIDLNDPKTRANLLDVMMASRSSSSCSSESSDDHPDYQHLHRIHRSRRHKKASASKEGAAALRRQGSQRVSIVGREDLFLRYGVKEREAMASFDFLDDLTSASSRESTFRKERDTLQ